MFSVKYQLFLNDVAFNLGYDGLLSYAMTKTYLSDIDYLLTTEKQIRFNQRQDRLYLDIDWGQVNVNDYLLSRICNQYLMILYHVLRLFSNVPIPLAVW